MVYLMDTAGAPTSDGIKTFVDGIVGGVTSNISLATVATVVAGIIGAGIVSIFAWKFARKGYKFVRNALAGQNGKM